MWAIVVCVWGSNAAVVRPYCGRSVVIIMQSLCACITLPQDINLAYLLAPFSYVNLILFTHVISHMLVDTYQTRYI